MTQIRPGPELMRVFAISDLHVDYDENDQWVAGLSTADYVDDLLILAGDVSDMPQRLGRTLERLALRFRTLIYLPGNHELWVVRDRAHEDSFAKFDEVRRIAHESGAVQQVWHGAGLRIVPLYGWYDFSFGEPSRDLRLAWTDFRACRWPEGMTPALITDAFLARNPAPVAAAHAVTITVSHFLPRIDVMPDFIPPAKRIVYPVLGTRKLEAQLRAWRPVTHVYGHSHVNRDQVIDGVRYVNNAFGYPGETRIAAKRLLCLHET